MFEFIDKLTSLGLWFDTIIAVLFLVLLIYVICSIAQRKSVIESSAADKTNPLIRADQIYYLPTASIEMTATARVAVSLTSAGEVHAAAVTSVRLENEVKIEADTDQLYQLEYRPSIFGNDELRIKTNSESLLQTVESSTEDALPKIITDITDAPKKILAGAKAQLRDDAEPDIAKVQVLEFTQRFTIFSDELNSSPISRTWLIPIEGAQAKPLYADASLTISFTPQTAKHLNNAMPVDGVLTRPLKKLKLSVATAGIPSPASYELMVPDRQQIINLPITRSAFVKKLHTPVLEKGLVIENYINKPSEAEGFVSIPINILKAIFSIPAQLLSFRIFHLQQETQFEIAKQQLAAAREVSKQQEAIAQKVQNAADDLRQSQLRMEEAAKTLNDAKPPFSDPDKPSPFIPDTVFIEAIDEHQEEWKKKFSALEISLGKKKVNGIDSDINSLVFKPVQKFEKGEALFVPIPPFISFRSQDGKLYQLPTDVQQTGGDILPAFISDADEACDINNPKRPGCSVSRLNDQATGTIGLKVYKNGRSYILSCYHVLCAGELRNNTLEFDRSTAQGNTAVISPGLRDNGTGDEILGTVAEGRLNEFFDCAIAELNDDLDVKARICRIDQEPSGILTVGTEHLKPRLEVFMSGRTSKFKSAFIKSSYASTDITYSVGKITLNGLIACTPLARDGDSGAVVFDEDCKIVGMVVARSPSDTYIIPISPILTEFQIRLKP